MGRAPPARPWRVGQVAKGGGMSMLHVVEKRPRLKLRASGAVNEPKHDTVPQFPAAIGPPRSQDLSLSSVPVVIVPSEEVPMLPLDARQGFVLSLIDGVCTLEEIIDVSALERFDTIEIIAHFVQSGIIALRKPPKKG
jgi:hypothetical protein